MHKEIFEQFVVAVNSHDVAEMMSMITPNHSLTDAAGHKVRGEHDVHSSWKRFFGAVPGYYVSVAEVLESGSTLAAFGFAGETLNGGAEAGWKVPVSWKVVMSEGKLASLHVFADTRLHPDIIFPAGAKDPGAPRATSIGGVFFKCEDPEKTKAWYGQHLGLDTDEYGTTFEWRQAEDPSRSGYTQWSPFKSTTQYFEPSVKEFMINYRVINLEALVEKLKQSGVTVTDKIESYEYGKFVHVMDCDGNKLELWEPDDVEYEKVVGARTR